MGSRASVIEQTFVVSIFVVLARSVSIHALSMCRFFCIHTFDHDLHVLWVNTDALATTSHNI